VLRLLWIWLPLFGPIPALAQLAYQGQYQGNPYKVYIYEKYSIGDGKWEFQTKTVYRDKNVKPIFSNRRIANCWESTIDGETVSAIARFSAEKGDAEVLRTVCRIQ
jgi:hypothetical protein